MIAELGGADQITVHLREDRRHIQDRDVRLLRETCRVPLNLEMAVSDEITRIALSVLPMQASLVPEKREEITTEGGLDVRTHFQRIRQCVDQLQGAGILVSLFIDQMSLRSKRRRSWALKPWNSIPDATTDGLRDTIRMKNSIVFVMRDCSHGSGAATEPRSRSDLPQCSSRRRDSGRLRTQHRTLDRLPRAHGRL